MALNMYNIKKWTKMLTGRSILHVNQNIGQFYNKQKVAGYYNDLTEKVTKSNLNINELPKSSNEKNKEYFFPIAIFQYGLGAYDLYLSTNNKEYLKRFKLAVDWAIENQKQDGGWECFSDNNETNTYSSMGQGEGISLLVRGYNEFKKPNYLIAIKKAIECMTRPINNGGTSYFQNNKIFLKEFPDKPTVLNGWIFSIFGIYDYLLLFPEDNKIRKFYKSTISTLKSNLQNFDLGYWSKYDIDSKISSPFYHKLHIALLDAMYVLTDIEDFKLFSDKFNSYSQNKNFSRKAFIKKSFQKILEK